MANEQSHPLIRKLEVLPGTEWRPREPGSSEDLLAVEKKYQLRLPDDYRALLLHSDGANVVAPKTQINLDPIEEISGQDLDDLVPKNLPGMFVIGGDGGGNVYFYDPEGTLGRGRWAIFLVEMSDLDLHHAAFLARTLTELVELASTGEDLSARLYPK